MLYFCCCYQCCCCLVSNLFPKMKRKNCINLDIIQQSISKTRSIIPFITNRINSNSNSNKGHIFYKATKQKNKQPSHTYVYIPHRKIYVHTRCTDIWLVSATEVFKWISIYDLQFLNFAELIWHHEVSWSFISLSYFIANQTR